MKRVGIIVGRFQVPKLTEGHYNLISSVCREFDKTVVFIGTTKTGEMTFHDPLPFEARKELISQTFPDLGPMIFEIRDIGDWTRWVEDLDRKIESLRNLGIIGSHDEVVICGSRDSVPTKYTDYGGTHKTYILSPFGEFSGTACRIDIVNKYKPVWTEESRSLAIWLFGRNDIKG